MYIVGRIWIFVIVYIEIPGRIDGLYNTLSGVHRSQICLVQSR